MIVLYKRKHFWLPNADSITKKFSSLFKVKMFTKNMYDYEELKYTLQDKVNIFEKKWGMLTEYYESIQPV